MKTILKLLVLTSIAWGCNNAAEPERQAPDSPTAVKDSLVNATSGSPTLPAEDPEAETKRQITEAIFSSKKEINQLESDISDSLSKSGLPSDRRSLFSKTIEQLEASSDILNRQLEQILVSDLQANRDKLSGIVVKMKSSQSELQAMIARLDKIGGYLQMATNLIQSLSPIKPVLTKPATKAK